MMFTGGERDPTWPRKPVTWARPRTIRANTNTNRYCVDRLAEDFKLPPPRLIEYMDSELIVKQLDGE